MRGRDRSEQDWHNTRGHMCSHRREFFVLTWNEQGRLLDTFSEKQEKRPRRFNFTRRSLNDCSK